MLCSISSITKCKVWWNFHIDLSEKNEILGQKRRDYILLKFFNCISISRELVVAEVCLRKELRTVVPNFVSADVFILKVFRERLEKSFFNLNHIRFSPKFNENPTVIYPNDWIEIGLAFKRTFVTNLFRFKIIKSNCNSFFQNLPNLFPKLGLSPCQNDLDFLILVITIDIPFIAQYIRR